MNMIRRTLMLCLVLASTAAHAQFGLRAGVNYTRFATKSSSRYQNASADGRPGYNVSVFVEKPLSQHLSLLPELQFNRQNLNLKVEDYRISDGSYSASYRLSLSYLNLPILVRAVLGKFYLEAGPQAGLQVAAHEKGSESLGSIAGSRQYEFDRAATDRYRRFDVGLCVGTGVRLTARAGLGVRAYTGLLSISHGELAAYNYGGRLINQSVQASLSYVLKSGN